LHPSSGRFFILLQDQREAEQREAEQREAEQREAEQREAVHYWEIDRVMLVELSSLKRFLDIYHIDVV
jgi:hypothetical protein